MNGKDQAVALALATALDSLPRRVRLSEAAVAAYGAGAPVFHGRQRPPYDGLVGAYLAELGYLVDQAGKTLDLDAKGNWKARKAIEAAGPGDEVRAALRALTGRDEASPGLICEGLGIGELAQCTGYLVRNPNDRHGEPQAMPKLAKFFEGAALFSCLAGVAKTVSRPKLDAQRELAAKLLAGPFAPMCQHFAMDDDAPPGWAIGMEALVLCSYTGPYAERLREFVGLPPSAFAGLWKPPNRRALSRGRPHKPAKAKRRR